MRRTGPNADYANVTEKRTNPLMAKKAIVSVKSSVGIRRRLRPEDRRRQILDGAISFFAEHGFEGGTRDLAKQLGVTQSLIFNYFPTKEELIREVYQSVYVGRWRSEWTDLISNTSVPLRARLIEFYINYTSVIFSSDWLRIYLFSGLKGLPINSMWIAFVEDHMIRRICVEVRRENNFCEGNMSEISAEEIETFWLFHSGIFYYGVRREVYRSPVHLGVQKFVETSVDAMLAALPAIMRAKVAQ
jgi:AcrR family transcriptional regulator